MCRTLAEIYVLDCQAFVADFIVSNSVLPEIPANDFGE